MSIYIEVFYKDLKMTHQCDVCGKDFRSISSLYMHKQIHKPSLILHQHPHPAFGMDGNQIVPKRNRADYSDIPNPKKFHEENNSVPTVGDSFDRREKRRKREKVKKDKNRTRKFRKYPLDGKKDEELEIVDSYEDVQADPGLKVVDSFDRDKDHEYDSDNEIIDSWDRRNKRKNEVKDNSYDDEQADPGLKVIDKYKYSYQKEYKKCEEEKEDLLRDIQKLKKQFSDKFEEQKQSFRDELYDKDKQHKNQIENLKEECEKEIRERERIHKIKIDEKDEAHEDEIVKLNKLTKTIEDDCKEKIELLHNQLKSEQEEEDFLSPLAKAIFNCTTIEEIFEIKSLIESHRISELKEKHFKTLQHMFLSLSYGILPICQPQRETITESQRKIVDQIQKSSLTTAKGIVKQNQKEIANLFSIIEDSLKLARNSFNRYGLRKSL